MRHQIDAGRTLTGAASTPRKDTGMLAFAEETRPVVPTPKGHATVAVIRLERQLATLTGADRAEVVARLRDLVDAVCADPRPDAATDTAAPR